MSIEIFQEISRSRRSVYDLTKNLPVTDQEIRIIVDEALLHAPSAFNSQSARVVILFNEEHERLWNLTENALKLVVAAENFEQTAAKLVKFKAAAGTILFFEETSTIKTLQKQFPIYAENFPIWSEQSNAMLQYEIWLGFAAVDVGANLQHYNPLIDDAVASAWNIPTSWTLRAQLVFGGIASKSEKKTFIPLDERRKIFGK